MKDSKCHSKFTLGHFGTQVNILKKRKLLVSSVRPANFLQVKLVKIIKLIIVLKRSMTERTFGKSESDLRTKQSSNTDSPR